MFHTIFSKLINFVAGLIIASGLVAVPKLPPTPPPVVHTLPTKLLTPEPVKTTPKPVAGKSSPKIDQPVALAPQPEPIIAPSAPVVVPLPVSPPPAPQPVIVPPVIQPTPPPPAPVIPACESQHTGTLVINTNQRDYDQLNWLNRIIAPAGFNYSQYFSNSRIYNDVPAGSYRIDGDQTPGFVPPVVSPASQTLTACESITFNLDFTGVKIK